MSFANLAKATMTINIRRRSYPYAKEAHPVDKWSYSARAKNTYTDETFITPSTESVSRSAAEQVDRVLKISPP
jgi:hypothetical protein